MNDLEAKKTPNIEKGRSDLNHQTSMTLLGGGFKYCLFAPGSLGKMNPF